jgi:LysR family transcriptional regulator, glycine cleavage system transcriptional activator
VSKQLMELESFLNCKLVERTTRSVSLTTDGAEYAVVVRELLERLESTTLRLRTRNAWSNQLQISVPASFGNRWLIPRLHTFYGTAPDCALSLSTHVGMPNFISHSLDCAIVFCESPPPGYHGELLFSLELLPVIAARLVDSRRCDWREVLSTHSLLDQSTLPNAWPEFLRQIGHEQTPRTIGAKYQLLTMGHQAALVGLGAALLPHYIVAEDLRRKRLIRLGKECFTPTASYHLLHSEKFQRTPAFDAFRSWLMTKT